MPGASVDVIDRDEPGGGHVLRVVFAGRDIRYRPIAKLLVLPPGAYVLAGEVKTEQLASARGVGWSIYCADGDQDLLGRSSAAADAAGAWHTFTIGFEIRPAGCHAAWLRLESFGKEPISGTILYDGLAIRRTSGAANSG
jgi:hypothetical protein